MAWLHSAAKNMYRTAALPAEMAAKAMTAERVTRLAAEHTGQRQPAREQKVPELVREIGREPEPSREPGRDRGMSR